MQVGTVSFGGKVHFIEEATNQDELGEFFDAVTSCGRTNPTFMAKVWEGDAGEVDCEDCIAVKEGRRYGKDLVDDP